LTVRRRRTEFRLFWAREVEFHNALGCEKKRNLKHEMDLAAKRRDFAEENKKLLYEFTFETRADLKIVKQEIP
jgi:hypothetical protein